MRRMALEREIKLRFESAADARERILSIGATPLRGRRLQEDCLLDTQSDVLHHRRCVLRVRNENGNSVLTFKGPVQPGVMKLREEHETIVADGETLLIILGELGLHVWFRYEKYREEFAAEDVIIALDEHIHRVAAALGRTPDDYITDSYRTLFLQQRELCGLHGDHMVFADVE
jgi:predicted adenylyl cyclase CyaB